MAKKNVFVEKVQRLAPRKGSPLGVKGSICINRDVTFGADGKITEDRSFYLNQSDYANALLSMDFNPELSITNLMGATIIYDELLVTDEMIAKGNGEFQAVSNGRPVTWKTKGMKYINPQIKFQNINITETDINNARMNSVTIKARLEREKAQLELGSARSAASSSSNGNQLATRPPAGTDKLVDEPLVEETEETPAVDKPVEHVNLNEG